MNQLPYDDPSALKQVLLKMASFIKTEHQIGAQIITQMTNTDCQRFVFTLIDQIIIPGDENPMINQIALVVLKNCLQNKKKCKFTSETFNRIRQKILPVMFNNTNHRIETILQQIFEILYKKVSNVQDIQTDLIDIKHHTTTTDPETQTILFLILQSLFHTPELIKKQLASKFEELAMWLINAGNQQTQALITEVRDMKLEIPASNKRREIPNFSKKIKALDSWLETVTQVVNNEFPLDEKITPEKVDFLQTKESYKKLPAILQDLLTLNISFENQPGSNDLIAMPIDTPAHSEINAVKEKVLSLLKTILEIFEQVNSQVDVTKFDFFQAVQNNILQFILTSLDSFLNSTRYRDLFENDEIGEIEEILSQSINFLCKTAAFKQLYSTTTFSISDLLIRCVLPLLRTPSEEQARCRDASSGYIRNLFEICFEQRFEERKGALINFVNALISDKNNADEKKSAVKLLLNLDELSISPDLADSLELAKYEDSHFMTETQPESRLEVCLLALASLHRNLDNNMKKTIGQFVQKHYSYLIDSPSMEIKVNFCLLIACYPENILNSSGNQDSAADCFRFILESVNIKDEESICLIQTATKTLDILFENASLSGCLVPYALDTFRVLTEIFLEDDNQCILNVILEILEHYELQILEQPDLLVDLIKTLTTKIEEGVQKENYLDCWKARINRARDLLRNILKKKEYILMVQNDLEQVTQPLLTLLQEIHIENREDTIKHQDLITLIIPLLLAVKNLTQTLLSNIFKVLPRVLEITHSLHHLFFALNDIIRDPTGAAEFNKNPEIVQLFIEIIVKTLQQKNSFDRSELICQGALLFQLLFQYVDTLTETHIENILETTCQLLKTTANPLIRVQLTCVPLNAFSLKFETSQAVLLKLDILNYFINCLIENSLDFDDFSYCRQVLTIGLSSLLNHQNISEEIQSRFPELFNLLISFLQTQQHIMNKTKDGPEKIEKFDYKSDKILLKKFLDNQDIMEEEEVIQTNQDHDIEENEDEGQEDDESNVKNRPISKFELQEMVDDDFKTEFKRKNALEFFKHEMSSLQQNKWGLFQKLIQSISEKKKKFLESLLNK